MKGKDKIKKEKEKLRKPTNNNNNKTSTNLNIPLLIMNILLQNAVKKRAIENRKEFLEVQCTVEGLEKYNKQSLSSTKRQR